MLLEDRFVGSFGIVAAGDDELIVKVAVAAVRNGFAVVPMQFNSDAPACALTAAAAKKEPDHECYHVLTEDTKVRATFQRLTKPKAGETEKPRIGLAIDLAASDIGVTEDVSWWVGPEISPTMVMPDGQGLYVFDLTGETDVPDGMITTGTLLVPPSQVDDKPVILVGQINSPSDNIPSDNNEEEDMSPEVETIWNETDENTIAMAGRIEALELQIAELNETVDKLRNALVVGLTAMKEIRDARSGD